VFAAMEEAGGYRFGLAADVARRFGVGPDSLRAWVRQAEQEGRGPAPAPAPMPEEPLRTVDIGDRVTVRWPAPLLSALRWPLGVYAASRLAVLAALVAAARTRQLLVVRRRLPFPKIPSTSRLLHATTSWDAGWYLKIAAHGYTPPHFPTAPYGKDIAFFPLFPVLVRWLGDVTGLSTVAAGVALTFIIGAVAVAAVWYATVCVANVHVANRVAVLWCFFPGAFVLSLVYAEGLTIACAALCLIGLVRRRWVLAGLAAAAAGASQPTAIVLVACCAWAALAAIRARRDWAALLAPVIAPSGAVAYFWWLWARTKDPTAWFDSERVFWAHKRMGPYWTIVRPVFDLFHHPGLVDNTVRVAGLLVTVALGWLLWRWRPPAAFAIFAAGTMFMALMSAPVGARPRFLLAAFPLIIAAGRRLPRSLYYAALAIEAPVLGLVTFATVTTLRIVP
jgi:mannosyltransferase PIG-V/transposase